MRVALVSAALILMFLTLILSINDENGDCETLGKLPFRGLILMECHRR